MATAKEAGSALKKVREKDYRLTLPEKVKIMGGEILPAKGRSIKRLIGRKLEQLQKMREAFWKKVAYAELPPTPAGTFKKVNKRVGFATQVGTTKAEEEAKARRQMESAQELGELLAWNAVMSGITKLKKVALSKRPNIPWFDRKFRAKHAPGLDGTAIYDPRAERLITPRDLDKEYMRFQTSATEARWARHDAEWGGQYATGEAAYHREAAEQTREGGLKGLISKRVGEVPPKLEKQIWKRTYGTLEEFPHEMTKASEKIFLERKKPTSFVRVNITPEKVSLRYDIDNALIDRGLLTKETRFSAIYDTVKKLKQSGVPGTLNLDIPELKFVGKISEFVK